MSSKTTPEASAAAPAPRSTPLPTAVARIRERAENLAPYEAASSVWAHRYEKDARVLLAVIDRQADDLADLLAAVRPVIEAADRYANGRANTPAGDLAHMRDLGAAIRDLKTAAELL